MNFSIFSQFYPFLFILANAATYQSTITELENLRNSYNESLKKYDILKNNYELSQKKEGFLQEDIEKKELVLQSYENKISAFQAEIKNLNDSLAEKENYIFELKSIKPNSVKREKEKIASSENKESEARLLFFFFFFNFIDKIFFKLRSLKQFFFHIKYYKKKCI